MTGNYQKIRLGILTTLLVVGLLVSLVGEVELVAAQTPPVAMDDTYSIVLSGTKIISAPGVLANDDYSEPITSLSVTLAPSYGDLVLNVDGSFSYTKGIYEGIDTFTYQLCDEYGCDTADVSLISSNVIYVKAIDDGGPDDNPGQKDLNFIESGVVTDFPGKLFVNWGLDNTDWTGANTGDVCVLFDTNGNGFADYSYCVTVNGAPATILYNNLWSCSDKKADRCTATNTIISPHNSTAIVDMQPVDPFYLDPLHTGNVCSFTTDPYNCYMYDTYVTTVIALLDMMGSPRLINVCSYPSESPNSDPSDCIYQPGAGFLEIYKIADPTDSGTFTFTMGEGQLSTLEKNTWTIEGSGNTTTVETIAFEAGTAYDLTEDVPDGWELTDAKCEISNGTSELTGTWSGTTITDFEIQTGLVTKCTFTNIANIDLKVTKSDGDYDPLLRPYYLSHGSQFTYTIDVEYVAPTDPNQVGATAYDVVMTDTLDPNLSIYGTFNPTVTVLNGTMTAPTCSISGSIITCGEGQSITMNAGDKYQVSFLVEVLSTAPADGLIETGTCWADPNSPTDWMGTPDPVYVPPELGGPYWYQAPDGPVDVCNLVSVSTTTYESVTSNNEDSEPTDIAYPNAAELLSFTATPLVRSIQLNWETASETDNVGFNLYRSRTLDGKKFKLNKDIIPSNVYPGAPIGATYEYIDSPLSAMQSYYYWIEDVDFYGQAHMHDDLIVIAQALKK